MTFLVGLHIVVYSFENRCKKRKSGQYPPSLEQQIYLASLINFEINRPLAKLK
jgi:hypothetical protein